MYRELIQRTSLIDLPIYALVLFVVVFAVLTVRVLLKNDFAEVADADGTGGRDQQAANRVQECGFTRPVAAEEADGFARAECQREVFEDARTDSVADRQRIDFDHGLSFAAEHSRTTTDRSTTNAAKSNRRSPAPKA